MKKLIIIIAIMAVILSLTSCVDDGNYPKDTGVRYDNAVDAIYDEVGVDDSEYLFELQQGNFVAVKLNNRRYLLYRDNSGYYPMNALDFNIKHKAYPLKDVNYPGSGFGLDHTYYAGKEVVVVSSVTTHLDMELKVSDSENTEVLSNNAIVDDGKYFLSMIVLDEISDDYKVIVNGEEYELPTASQNRPWYILLGIIASVILVIVIMRFHKSKYKRRMKKFKDIF